MYSHYNSYVWIYGTNERVQINNNTLIPSRIGVVALQVKWTSFPKMESLVSSAYYKF